MSNWRAQLEEESGSAAVTAWFGQYYHYLAVIVLAVFMLWNRTQTWGRFVVGEEILFSGNDPWYHYRSVSYTIEQFPENMPFDPWTFFSFGTSNSQFGTIFDQTVAAVAMILGLGNPSDHLVRMILLFTPVVVSVLVLLPTYKLGRRFGGRFGGIISAIIVALSTGVFLRRGVTGFSDHHIVEALLQATAVLGMMIALRAAQQEKPVWELFRERNVDTLRRTVAWSVLAGVAVGLYLWVWPPGILLLGIIGVFFLLHLSFQFVRGNSPEHTAIAGAIAMTTTGVMNVATLGELVFRGSGNTLLQPTLAFGVALFCVFMAWLARVWEGKDINRWAYPATVVGVIAVGIVIVALGLPGFFDRLITQAGKVIGFVLPQSTTVQTIGETEPLRDLASLYEWHGLAIVLAGFGMLMLLWRQYREDDPRSDGLLLIVWILFIISAVLTQRRFAYYLAVPLAVASAVPIGWLFQYLTSLDDADRGIQAYQVLTVAMVLALVITPMFVLGTGPVQGAKSAPGAGIVGWEDSLDWIEENTPAPGTFNNSEGEAMAYFDEYSQTDDFDYPEGSYGVVSWWDYGHWITALGERIPNANPFQQGATDAARFLLAQNETEVAGALARVNEDDAKTRYAMIDWKMVEPYAARPVRGKFFAPPTFHPNVSGSDFTETVYINNQTRTGLPYVRVKKQAYYESMVTRLYEFHGSAVEPQPIVVDWDTTNVELQSGDRTEFNVKPRGSNMLRRFPNMSAAEAYVAEDDTSQIGGIGPNPSEPVDALEHYRVIQVSGLNAAQTRRYLLGRFQTIEGAGVGQLLSQNPLYRNTTGQQMSRAALAWLSQTRPAWTKIFERVPGATVQGNGPPNSEVQATVQLQYPDSNQTFRYTQNAETDGNGDFELNLPYSTTGYDDWGPEQGHTNVSIRASGPYRITTPRMQNTTHIYLNTASVNVSEAKVIGEDPEPITVELERRAQAKPGGGTDDGTGSSGEGGDSSGDGGGQGALAPPTRLGSSQLASPV